VRIAVTGVASGKFEVWLAFMALAALGDDLSY
jgi:hypothetical protein